MPTLLTLPPILLHQIIYELSVTPASDTPFLAYLFTRPNLASAALVCRAFVKPAQSLLFRTIFYPSARQMRLFIAGNKEKEVARRCVTKTVIVNQAVDQEVEQGEGAMMGIDGRFGGDRITSRLVMEFVGCLKGVESLEIQGVEVLDKDLLTLDSLTKLKSLHLYHCTFLAPTMRLLPTFTARVPFSLTSLRLHVTHAQNIFPALLDRSTPTLRQLWFLSDLASDSTYDVDVALYDWLFSFGAQLTDLAVTAGHESVANLFPKLVGLQSITLSQNWSVMRTLPTLNATPVEIHLGKIVPPEFKSELPRLIMQVLGASMGKELKKVWVGEWKCPRIWGANVDEWAEVMAMARARGVHVVLEGWREDYVAPRVVTGGEVELERALEVKKVQEAEEETTDTGGEEDGNESEQCVGC
ncbi:hypothetical protein MNV49_005137 [Pseudohyphozyma bogoriensis]|nr:hypothetical protein MNV49_005137 [Pseudohyphozyma bogoriensis]